MQVRITSNSKAFNRQIQLVAFLFPDVLEKGLIKSVRKSDRIAKAEFLNGSQLDEPGSYPVPVRKGHLRRSMYVVKPGENGLEKDEAALGNSAEYAIMIHEGRGTSKNYGKRPFLRDSVDKAQPVEILRENIADFIKSQRGF